jgi:peptidoglycan/xylan/chitin deacetylase (PgdA/CDA1 family)
LAQHGEKDVQTFGRSNEATEIMTARTGTLVISLDFELMWGVRDHRTQADYGDAVLGGRRAIPEMLNRFKANGIRATWATVGFLMARNREELLQYLPPTLPAYQNEALSPYNSVLKTIGNDERDDPMHFARSLFEQIRDTDGQEIGTHTFSHYYCLEKGPSSEAFEADLMASLHIAKDAGVDIKSIVFPRNQMSEEHVAICARHGVRYFRGNPAGFAYRSRPQGGNTPLVRGLRLVDSVAPILGRHSYKSPAPQGEAIDVPASRFFRPYAKRLGHLNAMGLNQILADLRHAAKAGEVYHLWWHPHNMGRDTDLNLARLDRVLAEFQSLKATLGMTSSNMGDFAPTAV